MLRTQSIRSAWAARLLFQIGASVTATVIASALFAVMPKPWLDTDASAVEKTSGGKFAARVASLDAGTLHAPLLSLLAFTPDDTPLATFALATVWDDAPPVAAAGTLDDKPTKSRVHAALRSEPHRPADIMPIAVIRASPLTPMAAAEAGSSLSDEGIVHTVLGSARFLWSGTMAAGGSLMTRLVPQ